MAGAVAGAVTGAVAGAVTGAVAKDTAATHAPYAGAELEPYMLIKKITVLRKARGAGSQHLPSHT